MIQSDHSRMENLAVTLISSYSLPLLKKEKDLTVFKTSQKQSAPLFKILELFQALALDQVPRLAKSSLSDTIRIKQDLST